MYERSTGYRVLFLDDDEATREIVAGVLGDEGYAVDVAGSFDEAEQHVLAADPHVVIADNILSGNPGTGTGIRDMAEFLRACHSRAGLLGATAGAMPELAKVFPGGVDRPYDCLAMPFDLDDMLAKVAALAIASAEGRQQR